MARIVKQPFRMALQNIFSVFQMQQFELQFPDGLTDRFPEWMDCIRASVHGCGQPMKAIAADLDMSQSELSKRLSDQADIQFLLKRLPDLLKATGNLDPIYWLIEKFCDDPEAKHRRNVAMVAELLPKLAAMVNR